MSRALSYVRVRHVLFGWINFALTAPAIYLWLGLPLVMRQQGWSGAEIGLFQLAGLPAVFYARTYRCRTAGRPVARPPRLPRHAGRARRCGAGSCVADSRSPKTRFVPWRCIAVKINSKLAVLILSSFLSLAVRAEVRPNGEVCTRIDPTPA